MREIKFRVWTGITMEYNVMAGYLGAFYVKGFDPEDTACMSPFNTIYSEQTHVMQLTGIIDKNGKEIWDGDILKNDIGIIVKVFYDHECLSQIEQQIKNYDDEFKWFVIGNIYQNPELLKK